MTRNGYEQLRILLAEDDEDVRAAICEFLRREGYHILEADNGQTALDIITRERMAFSIMDVDMPRMTGFEVLRALREQRRQLPCIFMSGDDSRQRKAQALALGAFSLIAKPVALDLLRSSMRRLLEHHYGKFG